MYVKKPILGLGNKVLFNFFNQFYSFNKNLGYTYDRSGILICSQVHLNSYKVSRKLNNVS